MSAAINKAAACVLAEVVSNKKHGRYHHIVLAVDEIAESAKPGNFIAVKVGGAGTGMVLRRAFAIYRANHRPGHGGTIELVISPNGAGSKWLAAQLMHAQIDLIGPLGTHFPIPKEPVKALLVGGGYGSAPLFGLAELLKSRGCRVDMALGAATADRLYAPIDGKRAVSSLSFATDDGSAGVKARIAEILPEIIAEQGSQIIYSCGPMAMLKAVQEVADRFEIQHQASVEESMACGIGVCMTCVVPLVGEDGLIRMSRTCIDGPVMDGEKVIWESDRIIPAGTWGELN
jgi:dihydroorotate dehydrogenase electron transfer subunit